MCGIKDLLENAGSGYQLHATAAWKKIWFLVVFVQLVMDVQHNTGMAIPPSFTHTHALSNEFDCQEQEGHYLFSLNSVTHFGGGLVGLAW